MVAWFTATWMCEPSAICYGTRHMCPDNYTLVADGTMRQSLRAPTRGSSGGDSTSAPARRCTFLQDAALKLSEKLPRLSAEYISSAQELARANNLPRSAFKGVSCCVACGYPTKRTAVQQDKLSIVPCKLCHFLPRKRKRGGRLRSKKETASAAADAMK